MADREVLALRELLAQRPTPPSIAERRTSFDAFAKVFPTDRKSTRLNSSHSS